MGAFELNDTRSDMKSDTRMDMRSTESKSENFCDHQVIHTTHEKSGTCDNSCECRNKPSGGDCGLSMPNPRCVKEENIIALKIYDSCRQQDCLTPSELGPARAAECIVVGDFTINEGEIIRPPHEAAAVSMDKLRIKKIMIVEKEPNSFRKGFWDIDLKYVFEYRLVFREADGCIIGSVKANSIYNKKVTLFGSEGSDLFLSTDLFHSHNESAAILSSEPSVTIEGKAVALEAEIKYGHRGKEFNSHDSNCRSRQVDVTIGLFSIVKLFRIVDLSVQSKGFSIPSECEEVSPIDPCEYFDNLSFPMDIFAPPQKPEFFAGISGDIPPEHNHQSRCCKESCRCDKHK